ncbi:hypothetical protein GCM10010522_51340 [Kribbella solani]
MPLVVVLTHSGAFSRPNSRSATFGGTDPATALRWPEHRRRVTAGVLPPTLRAVRHQSTPAGRVRLPSGLSPSVPEFHQVNRSPNHSDRVADCHRRLGITPTPEHASGFTRCLKYALCANPHHDPGHIVVPGAAPLTPYFRGGGADRGRLVRAADPVPSCRWRRLRGGIG